MLRLGLTWAVTRRGRFRWRWLARGRPRGGERWGVRCGCVLGVWGAVCAGGAARGGLRDVDGCVVMAWDMPAVTAVHLRALMASGEVTASSYAARRGVPAYFPSGAFPSLMDLRGDVGARELLRSARCVELA